MPRLALLNMMIGFGVVFVSACGGIFVAFDLTETFLRDQQSLGQWQEVLSRSAHGHFNLFGMLHVLFGLTLGYSQISAKFKRLQTMGLALGTLAMGPGLLWRGMLGPTESYDLNGLVIGVGACAAIAAIAMHVMGLAQRYMNRSASC